MEKTLTIEKVVSLIKRRKNLLEVIDHFDPPPPGPKGDEEEVTDSGVGEVSLPPRVLLLTQSSDNPISHLFGGSSGCAVNEEESEKIRLIALACWSAEAAEIESRLANCRGIVP